VIGQILRPLRAGENHLATNHPAVREAPPILAVSSSSFDVDGNIPRRCAGRGEGDNVSPAVSWSGAPEGTKELVLVVEDPSAPLPRPFVHCVVAAIPPGWSVVEEGGLVAAEPLRLGRNSMRRCEYAGPRPVKGHGPHIYAFQLFAVDRPLALGPSFGRRDVLEAMRGFVTARGRLDGTYER
jgi:Raf kinase inhibitor-like YbhB/YbcL family protein